MQIRIEKTLPSLAAVEALDETLRAFPAFRGLSTSPGLVILHLDERAAPADQAQLEAAARGFDATKPTPTQERRAHSLASLHAAAQPAVGVALADLTADQARALLACLLYKNRAVSDDGSIRPLAEWL